MMEPDELIVTVITGEPIWVLGNASVEEMATDENGEAYWRCYEITPDGKIVNEVRH
jgi:hypothetical protein